LYDDRAPEPAAMPRTARPPGPKGRLLSGHIHEFHNFLEFLPRCAREFGDIVTFRFGPRRVYLLNHPDLIEQVLVTDARHFHKHQGLQLFKVLLGNGLVTSEGDFWLRQRRLAQPAFLKHRVAGYGPVMVAMTERHLAGWRPGQERDLHTEMEELTGKIALKALFDLEADVDRHAFNTAHTAILRIIDARFRRLLRPPDWLPTPENVRLRRHLRHLDAVLSRFVQQGRERPTPGTDLLSVLLHARDDDGSRMTDRQLRDEAMTLFLAGHETTALVLTWTWYLLAHHPAAEERLAAEWDAVLGERPTTPDDVPRLPFTECVVLESMRLRPPVYVLGREATAPVELGGYRFGRGATVLMSQWVTHRDPRWFDDPEAFRPERWADGLIHRIPKYAYYPFGGGPRVCIGNTFAMLEAVLLLAAIGRRFRFRLVPGHLVEPWPSITLRPRYGLRAVLAPRRQLGANGSGPTV
jgi:cytochrome P450